MMFAVPLVLQHYSSKSKSTKMVSEEEKKHNKIMQTQEIIASLFQILEKRQSLGHIFLPNILV